MRPECRDAETIRPRGCGRIVSHELGMRWAQPWLQRISSGTMGKDNAHFTFDLELASQGTA